jgi:LPS export ABC transporter protein LptC/lipopolysaccharide transport protein LptA
MTNESTIKRLQIRAKLPFVFRVLSFVMLVGGLIFVGVGFYTARNNQDFRSKNGMPQLSDEVKATIIGYERREANGNVLKYLIKADKATTYFDNHQELENAYIEVYDENGEHFDKISGNRAVYVPNGKDDFKVWLSGNVDIETKDKLVIKSESISYNRGTETAETEELIEFRRENISGKSFGAIAKIKEKQLQLLNNVEIYAFSDGTAQHTIGSLERAKITSNKAFFDQLNEKIDFEGDIKAKLTPLKVDDSFSKETDVRAENLTAIFENREIKRLELSNNVEILQPNNQRMRSNRATAFFENELTKVDLKDNVKIDTNGENPANISSQNATYDKKTDTFELISGVNIFTNKDNKPTVIRSNEATYEQSKGLVFLRGSSEIVQSNDIVKGDLINATLNKSKKITNAIVKGNAYLQQVTDRTTEVWANEFDADFDDNQTILLANARGNVRTNAKNPDNVLTLNGSDSLILNFTNGLLQKMYAKGTSSVTVIPMQPQDYTKLSLNAPRAITLALTNGILRQMQTEGRTTISMNATNSTADAADKKLTADSVKTYLNTNGKDLQRAEAIGNAELIIEPLRTSKENYRTNINANRFDCEFFQTGNDAKNCVAIGKTKTVRVPIAPSPNRGTQNLIAENLNAIFNAKSKDIEILEALGSAKFSENDRNGLANQIIYSANDEIVRLRGGEPTVFDSSARAKAGEIDWFTREEKSVLRGKVATTYYSQKQTNGATPFAKVNSPVYVTADSAEFNHRDEVGSYDGNARAWQENNFIRADKLLLQQKSKRIDGDGNVQSLLTNAKQSNKNVPVFATSDKFGYSDESKVLRYEGNVDIRQGTDRINAGIADVYLDEKNEVKQTIAQNKVVITQPKRRATGDFAQYTASTEDFILRGNPASIDDAEQGSSRAGEISLNAKTKVFSAESKKPNSGGRIRTVYKVKKQ